MPAPGILPHRARTQLADLHSDDEDIVTSLGMTSRYLQEKILAIAGWYMRRNQRRTVLSKAMRLGAITFAALGGVVALLCVLALTPGRPEIQHLPVEVGQLGYVAFALAAGCIVIDRVFCLSTGWTRLMGSALALQRALAEFQLDWARMHRELGGQPPTQAQAEQMLLRLEELHSATFLVVELETQIWMADLQSSLTAIHQFAKMRAHALEAGPLDVIVSSGALADDGLALYLDGILYSYFHGTRTQLSGVRAGHHVVMVLATIRGIPVESTATTQLSPGAIGTVSVALPVPHGSSRGEVS
ncbi:SLATT domain-containing protein [Chondromyces crocatus]|nr:SLATT domain-containing protein [Chondromyces crocatus]